MATEADPTFWVPTLMQYLVMPVVGWATVLHRRLNKLEVDLKVLTSVSTVQKESFEKEIKKIDISMAAILAKLDSIETHLRS